MNEEVTGGAATSSPPAGSRPTIVRRTRGLRFLDLGELSAYRELLFFLAWRDITVRYKQTVIGIAWAVLQPLAMMLVFTLFFGRLAGLPSDGAPYPLFALAALLPWQLFSKSLGESTNSLVTDQRLISRVYFPRLIIPTAKCIAALVDFGIASVLLILVMFNYGVTPGWQVVFIPLFLLLLLLTALGAGYWLSALNLEYRDVRHIIPFLTRIWMFVTPVVYPASLIPEGWRTLYALNPMVGVIEGFRWALLGSGEGPGASILVSCAVSIVMFVSGIIWFRVRERTFVDAIGSGGS